MKAKTRYRLIQANGEPENPRKRIPPSRTIGSCLALAFSRTYLYFSSFLVYLENL